VRHTRRLLFCLLAMAFAMPGAAGGQATTTPVTVPTVSETQSFTLTVPAPPPAPSTPVALPNRSRVEPAAAPLPRSLAYTGTNPLPLIAAGLAIVGLSLLTRRWSRARLRARAGV